MHTSLLERAYEFLMEADEVKKEQPGPSWRAGIFDPKDAEDDHSGYPARRSAPGGWKFGPFAGRSPDKPLTASELLAWRDQAKKIGASLHLDIRGKTATAYAARDLGAVGTLSGPWWQGTSFPVNDPEGLAKFCRTNGIKLERGSPQNWLGR